MSANSGETTAEPMASRGSSRVHASAAMPPIMPSQSTLSAPASSEAEPVCPITQLAMTDPVVCADGHTYERGAIETWLVHSNRSPATGLPLTTKQVFPNILARGNVVSSTAPVSSASISSALSPSTSSSSASSNEPTDGLGKRSGTRPQRGRKGKSRKRRRPNPASALKSAELETQSLRARIGELESALQTARALGPDGLIGPESSSISSAAAASSSPLTPATSTSPPRAVTARLNRAIDRALANPKSDGAKRELQSAAREAGIQQLPPLESERWVNAGISCYPPNFTRLDLSGRLIRGRGCSYDFREANLSGARLLGESCSEGCIHGRFDRANMRGLVCVEDFCMKCSHFDGADLTDATLTGHNLGDCEWHGAKIRGARVRLRRATEDGPGPAKYISLQEQLQHLASDCLV